MKRDICKRNANRVRYVCDDENTDMTEHEKNKSIKKITTGDIDDFIFPDNTVHFSER